MTVCHMDSNDCRSGQHPCLEYRPLADSRHRSYAVFARASPYVDHPRFPRWQPCRHNRRRVQALLRVDIGEVLELAAQHQKRAQACDRGAVLNRPPPKLHWLPYPIYRGPHHVWRTRVVVEAVWVFASTLREIDSRSGLLRIYSWCLPRSYPASNRGQDAPARSWTRLG